MSHLRYYGLLTLLCCCLYLPGLASLPLFDRDEPHFAQASRQMIESHHYWQINFQDEPRHLKPPGIYWLQAMMVRAFSSAESTSPWPYRFPSVLGAWLAVVLTFRFSSQITDKKVAAIAATLLASCLLLITEAHLAVTDAALLPTMVAMQFALGQIYCHYRRQQQTTESSLFLPMIFWLAMSAGIIVKGITPLVGGLTILGLCIADWNVTWLKALRWQWGINCLNMCCRFILRLRY
jgi:4-amino-4-deoxy-L-arabinose transferase-like glycosyltransferase